MAATRQDTLPVIRNLADFDPRSGNCLERLVFNHRWPFLLCMLLATLVLGFMAATRLELRPSFDKMLPQSHPTYRTTWKTALRCADWAMRYGWW